MNRAKHILVVGVFDLFHVGHVKLLKKARHLGDKLFIIINGDKMTSEYKRKPVYSESDRMEIIKACKYVDQAVISNEFDVKPYIEKFAITYIVHGDDWDVEDYMRQIRVTREYLEHAGTELVFFPYHNNVSTTSLRKGMRLDKE